MDNTGRTVATMRVGAGQPFSFVVPPGSYTVQVAFTSQDGVSPGQVCGNSRVAVTAIAGAQTRADLTWSIS